MFLGMITGTSPGEIYEFESDPLSTECRNHIIDKYIATELRDYRRIFSAGEVRRLHRLLSLKLRNQAYD